MLLLEGALIALAGVALGRFLPARRRTPKPLPPSKPVCGCGHHRSFHKDAGRCQERVYVSYVEGHKQCGCGEYVGPEPVPAYYAPEIGA